MAGHPGIAVVVAMLQEEDARQNIEAAPSFVTPGIQDESAVVEEVAKEQRIGDAVRAELELERLQLMRSTLLRLSKEVLDARCPGFCARANISDEDYMREAGYALATFAADVAEAERALHASMMAVNSNNVQ